MIRTRIDNSPALDMGPKTGALPTIDRRQKSRRSEDYFWLERLSEMSNQAFMVFDASLNIEFANGFTLELFDLSQTEFQQLTSYDDLIEYCINRGDFGKGVEQTLNALSDDLKANVRLQSGSKNSKLEISTPLGRRLCLKQSYGRDDRMLLVIDDITEQYETETALEVALKVGAAGYLSYKVESEEWNIASKSMIEYFGASRISQAEKQGLEVLVHEDDRERARQIWFDSIKTGETFDMKLRFVSKHEDAIWFRAYGVPRLSENNKVASLFCYYIDITEEMRLQKEQREAVKTAKAALKAKNSFLARLSHEIRTPMNAVVGISDALLVHHNFPEITPKLELIQNSAEKIIRIVDETLTHSKMEEGKISLDPSPTSPAKCVENVCQLWEEKATKNQVVLTYHIDKNLPDTIVMDGYRYEQCLNNLLSNAIKFTQGGKVQVVLKTLQKDGLRDRLVLAVKDNGIGMTPEQQSHIFEEYTQASHSISSQFGGTGLGTTITKQLTELMGGSIRVKSEENKGTVFVIAIPYGEVRAKQKAAVPTPLKNRSSVELIDNMLDKAKGPKTTYSHLKILVVDDNETNHLVVTSLLGSLVREIVTATDGLDAIRKLETDKFDMILMDIHMPVMDGIEATLSIRGAGKAYSDIPIIALTADPQYQQKRLCLNIGMNEALSKPVRLSEILGAIDSVLEAADDENKPQKIMQNA